MKCHPSLRKGTWVEIFKTSDFEGYSGMLVFFTFMPAGAMIGGLGGAALFWHSGGPRRRNRGGIRITDAPSGQAPEIGPHLCNAKLHLHFGELRLLQNFGTALQCGEFEVPISVAAISL
jgi:hypothetical protein